MKRTHNFKFYMVALILMICILFTACKSKFTCDLCGMNSRGEKYDMTSWGRGYVCEDCYNYLWGRGR